MPKKTAKCLLRPQNKITPIVVGPTPLPPDLLRPCDVVYKSLGNGQAMRPGLDFEHYLDVRRSKPAKAVKKEVKKHLGDYNVNYEEFVDVLGPVLAQDVKNVRNAQNRILQLESQCQQVETSLLQVSKRIDLTQERYDVLQRYQNVGNH